MATLLYRLGHWAYERPWRVLVSWLLILGAVGGLAVGLGGKLQNSFAIPGTESQQAIDKLAAVFPQTAGATIQVVFEAPEGDAVEHEPYASAIEDTVEAITRIDGVEAATSPFSEYAVAAVSESGRAAIAQVTLSEQQDDVKDSTTDAILDTASIGEDAGLTVEYTGGVLQTFELGVSWVEGLGVAFAAVVLIFTFGSMLAAGMPLLIALFGVGIAMAGMLAAAAFAPVSSTAPMLGLMIGLAVGIDYSLFIISRHRNQLATGMDPRESTGIAVATAGSAVVFAGLTVIIALLGLLVVGIPFLSVMGVGAAVAVFVAVAAALTMLPALLGLAKHRLVPKAGSKAQRRALAMQPDATEAKPSFGARWVKLVLKAPIVVVVLVVGLLGSLLLPALQLQLSLPDAGSQPESTTTRKAYDIIADEFGPGRNGPLIVLVDITQTTDIFDDLDGIAAKLEKLDDVARVGDGIPNETVDTAIIQVIPKSAPDSPETTELVQNIRDLEAEIDDEYGTPIQVTGATAVYADISSTLMGALLPFAGIVVGLSILLLMMVFRSLFVPLTAALGFLLSVIAAIGSVVAVFQLGYGLDVLPEVVAGPILSFLPILLIAVLFGLAMDYQVFLVSGMREEYVRTKDARASVSTGFAHAARVVTAAALIMFFVFFSFVPEGPAMIKPIALGLAVGVVVDAFLVRMTLIPALMALAGKAAWYLPKWLGRILPNVDIEGESLEAHREGLVWAARHPGEAVTLDGATTPALRQPITAAVPNGGIGVFVGDRAARSELLATIAGRLELDGGHAQVTGRPLPTDAASVARRVAIVDAAPFAGATVGELLRERIALGSRKGRRRGQYDAILDRVNQAMRVEELPPVRDTDATAALAAEQRIAVAFALGVASGAEVVALDLPDIDGDHLDCVIRIADLVLPVSMTVVLGTAASPRSELRQNRPLVVFPLGRQAVLA